MGCGANALQRLSRNWLCLRKHGRIIPQPRTTRSQSERTTLLIKGACLFTSIPSLFFLVTQQIDCRIWFRPRVMRDVSEVDYSTSIFGQKTSMPVYIVSRVLHSLYMVSSFSHLPLPDGHCPRETRAPGWRAQSNQGRVETWGGPDGPSISLHPPHSVIYSLCVSDPDTGIMRVRRDCRCCFPRPITMATIVRDSSRSLAVG